ncbi:hypothetical protein [Streptomyces aureus]|uniref:hypothetical protein n=1 Tax=Streptomyces aureus TaxID=193461 RepID=UPI0036C32831
MTSTDTLNLNAIEARAARLYERTASIDPNAHPDFGQLTDTDVPALLAEVRRLRARVWEHERPATEAERNALRQSFMELAAQAREDRDFEGAFGIECDLRKREEQWKREDAARPDARTELAATRSQIADEVVEWSGQQVGVHVPTVDAIADLLRGAETHVVADGSDDPEHVDDCPGCEAFTLTGHRAAEGAQR